MKCLKLVRLALVLTASVATVTAFADETDIQGVSPGAPDRSARVGSACPTFNWEASPGVEYYEVVVYRLTDEVADVSTTDLSRATEVLYTAVPGRANGWTPEAADCFIAGDRYAWFIRAVVDQSTGETGEWSAARFFEIEPAPSRQEIRDALAVLTRYAESGESDADLGRLLAGAQKPSTHIGSDRSGSRPKATIVDGRSVITGTAAIRGEQPDVSGETYGVVGTSASPDGAGIGAANTSGGPDLVLDGAVPAEFSEMGIDRFSGSPQSYSFTNTGGGGMMIDINGIDVVTVATDQDTIGDLTCGSGQLAKWNGATWVCAPDLDTDTLTGLVCDPWQIPKWTGSHWECAIDWNTDALGDLACGPNEIPKYDGSNWVCAEDEDTTYDFGSGLTVENGQVVIDPAAFTPQVSTLDTASGSLVGRFPSIAIGTDDLGLISYNDSANDDLMVAHCNDIPCTSATLNTVDGGEDNTGFYTSITIGADGLGLISYLDITNDNLKVAHCDNILCSSATISTLDSVGTFATNTSISIGIDGLGLISYYDSTNGNLKVAHCGDVACSSATVNTLDSSGNVGIHSSIAIGPLGLGIVSYHDYTNGDLKLAQCSNVLCTSAIISTLDGGIDTGYSSSIATGADNLALITYYDQNNKRLKVAHCDDVLCASWSRSVLDINSGTNTSLAIAADGFGLISYLDSTEYVLKVAHCRDASCSHATTRTLTSVYVDETSIAIGTDGLGLISYRDGSNNALKVAHLPYGY